MRFAAFWTGGGGARRALDVEVGGGGARNGCATLAAAVSDFCSPCGSAPPPSPTFGALRDGAFAAPAELAAPADCGLAARAVAPADCAAADCALAALADCALAALADCALVALANCALAALADCALAALADCALTAPSDVLAAPGGTWLAGGFVVPVASTNPASSLACFSPPSPRSSPSSPSSSSSVST